jgi:hypothetical protein
MGGTSVPVLDTTCKMKLGVRLEQSADCAARE